MLEMLDIGNLGFTLDYQELRVTYSVFSIYINMLLASIVVFVFS